MFTCNIHEYRRGSARAELVPAYKATRDGRFAVHRAQGSTTWTVSLAHTVGPAGSLIPPAYPRKRDLLLALIGHVEAKCPAAVEVWRGIGAGAMRDGLTNDQAAAGREMLRMAMMYADAAAEA